MKIKITMPSRKRERYHSMQLHSRWVGLALALLLMAWQLSSLEAQTVIGGEMPDPSAILDLQSTDKGLLLPRLTQEQRESMENPAKGLLIYNVTSGCLEINHGSLSTPMWSPLGCLGTIGSLGCGGTSVTSVLNAGLAASGVTASVPYTGGNGGSHVGQTVASAGVTGLTATLPAGNFVNGAGSLAYAISGTPAGTGTASFALDIGGQSCMLAVTVIQPCGAYVAPGQWKHFMCHNLAAANLSADPFTPGWEVNGGYWQWGRKGPAEGIWQFTNMYHYAHGPLGPGTGDTNEAAVPGWSPSSAPNGAWADAAKTQYDPCPEGFRVPTEAEWDGVRANNSQVITGNWSSSSTNYSAGRFFGPDLMLPAAGNRGGNGSLQSRGGAGYYWSSTGSGTSDARYLFFNNAQVSFFGSQRTTGYSVRCIAE